LISRAFDHVIRQHSITQHNITSPFNDELSEGSCTEMRNKHTYMITNAQIHTNKLDKITYRGTNNKISIY